MARDQGGRDFRIYRNFSFKGGLDVYTSPLELTLHRPQDRLTKAQHMVYTFAGGVSKRYDQDKVNTNTLGASVAITGGMQFRHSNGTDYNVCGTNDGRLVLLNTNGTTTDLATGLTTDRRWSFATYNDKLIAVNGADAPRYYDGSAVSALGGTPPATASVVVSHSNRVFMLDETSTSRLTWSALNNEENYTAANNAGFVYVDPQNSQRLVGMVSSSQSELVLCKPNTIYRLQGTAPSTYAITNLVPASSSAGGVSFQAIVHALNDVWLLANDGIHNLRGVQEYGDLKESYISQKVAPYFRPDSGYSASFNRLGNACGAYDRQNGRLYWAIDTDNDAQNDTLLVYDLALQAWSVWPSQSIASMWVVRNATTGLDEICAGGYDGFARFLNRASSTNAISGEARHISDLDAPGIEKSPRHIFLYLKEEGNYSVTVDTKFDFGGSGGQSYSVSLLGSSKTLGVNWTLGTDALGARTQVVKRLNVSGIGEFLELGVANGNAGEPFTWYGYEVFWRPRRVLRRAGTA